MSTARLTVSHEFSSIETQLAEKLVKSANVKADPIKHEHDDSADKVAAHGQRPLPSMPTRYMGVKHVVEHDERPNHVGDYHWIECKS